MNEKYCGDVLCQKTYTADFLTSDVRKNKGELPQYFIENNHPAIITKEVFRQVQEEMLKRASTCKPKEKTSRYSSKYALTGKVVCAECGALYRRTTWTNRAKVAECLKQLGIDIPQEMEELSLTQEERLADCFDVLVRQTVQKVIVLKLVRRKCGRHRRESAPWLLFFSSNILP